LATDANVPVLIVGGSLVGLTASVLLAARGVPHLLVERHPGTAIHPRAASFHQRTMEIYRSVGLQGEIEAAAAREFVQNGAIVAVDSLAGRELACFYRSYNDDVEGLSPTSRLFITQVGLEPILRDRAQALGADLRFGTELQEISFDDDGISAVMRPPDGGPAATVHARYLIAADGAHSPIRESLDIGMKGRGSFADCATIYFRADLRVLIGDRNLSVVYINRPDLLAFFRFAISGDAGFLAVFATFDEAGRADRNVARDLSVERAANLVRVALGVDADFPVQVEGVQPWTAAASAAERFCRGRIYLCGDAAHVMPPTGGFGGNTGIGDAHNLVWKLAMVLRGEAEPALLDSYDAERRPYGALVVEQAYRRFVDRVDPSLPADGLAPPFDDASIELGAVYRSGAVIDDDTRMAAPLDDPRTSGGAPGTRLRHVPLRREAEMLSTLDLAGPGFSLLAGRDGSSWVEEARARRLDAYRIAPDGDATDPEDRFERSCGIGRGGAVLVRPDGVVAWRSIGADDAATRLDHVLRRICGRSPTAARTPGAITAPAAAGTP
jgi:2-polyprenyl-6-methoxyphenol hydroxylase-like FAD-dependent oxidoreductase